MPLGLPALCPFFFKRQKVKTYFLPVQSAKKVRRSLPFFGEKATQHQSRADFLFILFSRWSHTH
jgi:hypothetical protein